MSENVEPTGEVLGKIKASAELVADRRGKYAAALWSVDDYLGHISAGLIPYTQTIECAVGKCCISIRRVDNPDSSTERWGLFIQVDDEWRPAHKAPIQQQVPAVRKLAEFVSSYQKALEAAAGTRHCLTIAEEMIASTAVS